jgi:hypothetical protein
MKKNSQEKDEKKNQIIMAKQFFMQSRKRITKNKTRGGAKKQSTCWIAGTGRRAGSLAPEEELARRTSPPATPKAGRRTSSLDVAARSRKKN